MSNVLILGIDPGLSGACAVIEAETGDLHALFDVPTHTTKAERRATVDTGRLASCLFAFRDALGLVVLEKVGAMPGNGVTSMFRFGEACGAIRGVLGGLGVWERGTPCLDAVPAVWKATMGQTADKAHALNSARRLLPAGQEHLLAKKGHHNRAEALLLAHFGRPYLKARNTSFGTLL